MPTTEEKLANVESLLIRINLELQKLLTDCPHTLKDRVVAIERLSRYKRLQIPNDQDPYAFAAPRADLKAKEYGQPFVVADTGDTLVTISKERFQKEAPYGLSEKDVVYDTSTTGPPKAPK
jgi:hypothetical protein